MRKKAIDWVLTGFSLAGIISTIPVMAVQLRINKTKNVGKTRLGAAGRNSALRCPLSHCGLGTLEINTVTSSFLHILCCITADMYGWL